MDNLIKSVLEKGVRTERLYMRKLSISDAADMFKFTNDVNNWKFISRDAHTDVNQAKDFIKMAIEKYNNPTDITWGIELINNTYSAFPAPEKLIGSLHLYDIDLTAKICTISYIINSKYKGKGYATEAIKAAINTAFHALKMNKVYADIAEGNAKSENVAKRCGMQKIQDYVIVKEIKGRNVDVYRYSIERNRL